MIGWKCEGGTPTSRDFCLPICGDGLRFGPWEKCDDKNKDNNDGCSSTCQEIEIGFIKKNYKC